MRLLADRAYECRRMYVCMNPSIVVMTACLCTSKLRHSPRLNAALRS